MALGALTACVIQTACVVHLNGVGADGIASHAVASPLPALVGIAIAVLGIGTCVTVPALRRPRWSAPIVLACLAILVGALLRIAPVKAVLILERASFHSTALLSGLTWVAVTLEAYGPSTSHEAPQRRFGRWTLLALPALGAGGLLALHVGTTVDPVLAARVPTALVATISVLSLLIFPIGSLAAWSLPATRRVGLAGVAVTMCVVARSVYTSDPGLLGGAADTSGAPVIGATLVVAALVTHVALRPRMETWVRGLISVLSILAVSLGWLAYSQAYGSYEDVLGDVIASFTGFRLPYPAYVPHWRATAAMVGAFLALSCVYGNLVAQGTRRRGIALALLCAAGLGFASPHLLLAFTAGGALLLTTRATERDTLSPRRASARLEQSDETSSFDPTIIEDAAERLALGPVVFADALTVCAGRVEGIPVELRHRGAPRSSLLTLEVGLPGKGKPELRVIPRRSPTDEVAGHPMYRTHRCEGDARTLEGHTALLDTMTRFPSAQIERWPSGSRASIPSGDPGLDVDGLEALTRAMVALERS